MASTVICSMKMRVAWIVVILILQTHLVAAIQCRTAVPVQQPESPLIPVPLVLHTLHLPTTTWLIPVIH